MAKEKRISRKNVNFLNRGDMWAAKVWAKDCQIMGTGICLKCKQEHNLNYKEAHGIDTPFGDKKKEPDSF